MVLSVLIGSRNLYLLMIEKTHIYLVPGLAASTSIFEFLELPENLMETHYLDWLVPESATESLEDYAARMCARVKHKNVVLIGVSFGGIMVQEMSKILKVKKTVIISSVKSKKELPRRLRLAKATKAYKLFPSKAINNLEGYAKYAFGETIKKRLDLYKKYLAMRDEHYLPWAIHNVLHWQQEQPLPGIVHFHGANDQVFPLKHIKDCTVIEGGTHVMILNKAKRISRLLIELMS